MEEKAKYVAKDGRQFDDPKRCGQYEKALDTDRNTIEFVERLLMSLEGYVTGIVICEHEGHSFSQPFVTVCVDDWLKDYVDVENLTIEQRYIDSSTKRCAAVLRRRFAKEDQCQYMLLVGKGVDMQNCELFYNFNPNLWELLKRNNVRT